jgi:hypothetical protein
MGSTLGANASSPHKPIHGQAYILDQRKIPQALVSLGAYRFPWWYYDPTPKYKAVGYFRADVLKPGDWVMSYPNPAHEKMTRRDAYWGAKIVMSFSDAALRRIVETGDISNPEAEDYLVQTLMERRDKIGRYWFDRINPLDRFEVQEAPVAAGAGTGRVGPAGRPRRRGTGRPSGPRRPANGGGGRRPQPSDTRLPVCAQQRNAARGRSGAGVNQRRAGRDTGSLSSPRRGQGLGPAGASRIPGL